MMGEEPFFLRLPQVLKIIPVSKSTWWGGIRSGKYPRPVKLSERTSAWRRSDIVALCERLSGNGETPLIESHPESASSSAMPKIRSSAVRRLRGLGRRTQPVSLA